MTVTKKSEKSFIFRFINLVKFVYKTYCNRGYALALLVDPRKINIIAFVLLIAEVALNLIVIHKVPYTEIDWIAYMHEVEGVTNGTFDYTKLKGDTGPLVYPAGFVYIFMILYYITEHGKNIRLAQYIFAGLYILLLYLVFRIYCKSKKVPPYALIFACCTSYRIHSIFVLRMFNDPVAVILFYISLNLFLSNCWNLGSIFFSLAVSVKMNILLYSPAILLAYWTCLGLRQTLAQLIICACVQVILGLPFLLTNPIGYLQGSFDVGRIFLYKWTVNWRCIPEYLFINRGFHIFLIVVHIALIILFLKSWMSYLRSYATLKRVEEELKPQLKKREKVNMETSSQLFLLPMFTCNLIGIACSRSLHYQFYVWYFHSLPYLLWSTPYSGKWRLAVMGIIELCWNTYPSTVLSSVLLHLCHLCMIYGIYRNKPKVTKSQ